jgi:hypothetical protein
MIASFSAAALDRMVKGVTRLGDADASWMDALSLSVKAAAAPPYDIYGDPEPLSRLQMLAGLIGLARRCGYVDAARLQADPAVAPFVQSLGQHALFTKGSDVTGEVQELLQALSSSESATQAPTAGSNAHFAAFESYLDLTIVVAGDEGCRTFLRHARMGNYSADVAVLLSPRHFASAAAGEAMGLASVVHVDAGLRVLGYFECLASVLESLADDPSLRDDFVRHAEWAAFADRVAARFSLWATHMAEWGEHGHDLEGLERWQVFKARVFEPLAQYQQRLTTPDPVEELLEEERRTAEAVPDIDRLVAEGRLVAARARAGTELSDAWRDVVMPSEEPWHQRFVAFIHAAIRLSDLGDYDVAATYVAPFLDKIDEEFGESWVANAARGIVAAARTGRQPTPGAGEDPATTSFTSETRAVSAAEGDRERATNEPTGRGYYAEDDDYEDRSK